MCELPVLIAEIPLKPLLNSLVAKDVDCLIGNLPELCKWQQSFFGSLEDCARFVFFLGVLYIHTYIQTYVLYIHNYMNN